MALTIKALAEKINANYQGEDVPFKGLSIDTRTLKAGELFAAIEGPNFDGHDFIDQAIEKGAAALLVSKPIRASVPTITTQNTTRALGELMHVWRKQFRYPIIGLTGTCGKTGTKEMIASILSEMGPTLATLGNKNNQLGVPLTLSRLTRKHQYAVIELGTNQPGEIAYLTKIVQPSIALITNIAANHLEGFSSLEELVQEKADLYANLSPNGIAVLNVDEAFSSVLVNKLDEQHRVTFGLERPADVSAEDIQFSGEGVTLTLKTPIGVDTITVPLLGEHVAYNTLAAAAACLAAGATLTAVKAGLSKIEAVSGRFKPHRLETGALLIDDTYNASSSSVKNALKSLSKFKGRKIFVMSNMAELGDFAEKYHRSMGEWVLENQIDHALFTGDMSLLKPTLYAAGEVAEYFGSKKDLINRLCELVDANTTILIKGSRSNRMEEVVQAMLEH